MSLNSYNFHTSNAKPMFCMISCQFILIETQNSIACKTIINLIRIQLVTIKHIRQGLNWGIIDSEEFKKAWEKQKHVFHFRFPTNQYIYNSFFVFRFYVLLFFLKKAIKFINKRQYNQRFDSFLQM